MFLFQISNYDNHALDMEAAKLFQQQLEVQSRRDVPFLWKIIDSLNAYAAKGPGRESRRVRYRIYGVILIAMGIFLLVPGLMEPITPPLILAGGFGILSGIMEFLLVRKRKPPRIPVSCQNAAKKLLSGRRAIDWSKITMSVSFDETGMTASDGEKQEVVPYEKMTGIFETENLWLLVYAGEKTLLLQKQDLVSGDAGQFSPYVRRKMSESTIIHG